MHPPGSLPPPPGGQRGFRSAPGCASSPPGTSAGPPGPGGSGPQGPCPGSAAGTGYSSRTRCPFPVPPMAGLQGMFPTASRFTVKHRVRQPSRALARAASIPAWPAPITATSYFPALYSMCPLQLRFFLLSTSLYHCSGESTIKKPFPKIGKGFGFLFAVTGTQSSSFMVFTTAAQRGQSSGCSASLPMSGWWSQQRTHLGSSSISTVTARPSTFSPATASAGAAA